MGAPDPAGIPPTPEPPAVPDEMWWSPSRAADPTTLRPGFIVRDDGRLTDGRGIGIGRDLPADAVRLVPESEVSRLREDKRFFQKVFIEASAQYTAVCEALGLSHEAETETVVSAIQCALHPLLVLDADTGEVKLAGAVPDTGHPPLPEVVAVVEAAQALAEAPIPVDTYAKRRRLDLIQLIRDRVRALPEGWRDGAAASPSTDTVPARELGEAIALIDSILPQAHIAVPYADDDDELDDEVEIAPLEDHSTWRQVYPDTGQAREPVMTETTRKLARRVTQYRRETLGWLKQAIRADGEAEEANNALIRERQIAVLTEGDGHVDCAIEPSQASESPTDSTPKAGRGGSGEAETATGAVQAPDVAARPALCPTCDSSQPHLHPHRDLCPDSWHQPVPTTSDEWRTEVRRWAGLLDQIVEHDIGSDAVRRLSGDMRRALLGTDATPDRLAWISEAGETAAVEWQARYQETACARRPAEETPDV